MAGVAFVTGQRYTNGATRNVFYIASLQDDGYVYFNDDVMWRCLKDGTQLQRFYFNKTNWIKCSDIQGLSITDFNVTGVIGGAINGGGAVATNGDVEKAVKWMCDKVQNNYITYSQTNRNLKNPNGKSYDCSSFVITGFTQGGFTVNATTTRDMKAGFTAIGFKWIAGSNFPASSCKRGDILLNESIHTQVYIGNNQDVNCGSTPARIITHSADNFGRGWNGILRKE